MFINYMVFNTETAECDVFGNKKAAEKNSSENTIIFPCDIVEDNRDAELLLYPNADHTKLLSFVAEFVGELSTDGLTTATENNPIRVMRGD